MQIDLDLKEIMVVYSLSLLSLSGDKGGVSEGDIAILILDPNGPRRDNVAWLRLILLSLLTGGAEGVAGAETVVEVLQVSPWGGSS